MIGLRWFSRFQLLGFPALGLGVLLSWNAMAAPLLSSRGKQFVQAAALGREAGVSVKRLPGSDAVAVCIQDRCAAIEGSFEEEGQLWLPVAPLADVLGLVLQPAPDGQSASISLGSSPGSRGTGVPKVGSLAPNFRLPRLDGSMLALSDFRGKRVLINSWASW